LELIFEFAKARKGRREMTQSRGVVITAGTQTGTSFHGAEYMVARSRRSIYALLARYADSYGAIATE
jgi:hypothetical protein